MSGFDLGQAQATVDREDEGIAVHIKDQTGKPMYFGDDEPVTWTVVGTYSKRYRKALDASATKLRQRKSDDIAALREDALDLVAECSLGWTGFFENGAPLTFSKANALKVLKLAHWIREQIETAMEDHEGFTRLSSES